MKKIYFTIIVFLSFISFFGCSKGWLEEKQDIKLIVPLTLNDLDMLLNTGFDEDGRGAAENSTDDATYTAEQFNSLNYAFQRNLAIWNITEFEQISPDMNEWDISYKQIQICNVVLSTLNNIERTNDNIKLYNRIEGTALYHRSRQFLNLALTFCNYYDASKATHDLGIPLKLSDDIDEPIFRASLNDTYQKIITDLEKACMLLPIEKISITHIARGGAYAQLARTYLFMDRFQEANRVADSSYYYHSFIEDYNNINSSSSRPLNIQSKEMHIPLYPRMAVAYPTKARIDEQLYNSYDENDLRKTLFFKKESDGKFSFRGHYLASMFSGTTTVEILLIAAECKARMGNIKGAMNTLNLFLQKRFKKGTFVSLEAQTIDDAINIVLNERRKELLTRCLRWYDLKRYNRDPKYAKSITRIIGTDKYTLPPNDSRYVLPIPQYIINFNGIEQNPY